MLVTTASMFAGWASSGARTRNAFALIDIADQAGIIEGGGAGLARLAFGVPFVAGVCLLAVSLARPFLAAVAGCTVGATVAVAAVLVQRSPLPAEWGLWIGAVAGAVTVIIGVASALHSSKQR